MITYQLIKSEEQKEQRRKKEAQVLKHLIHDCFKDQAKRLENS